LPEDAFEGLLIDMDGPVRMTVVGSAKIQTAPDFRSLVAVPGLSLSPTTPTTHKNPY